MLAMFRATGAAPVVGGYIRSGMATRIALVRQVLAGGNTPHQWVCQVVVIGAIYKGVWRPQAPTRCYGSVNNPLWLGVHSTGSAGWHAVVAGPLCPVPQGATPGGYPLCWQPRPGGT